MSPIAGFRLWMPPAVSLLPQYPVRFMSEEGDEDQDQVVVGRIDHAKGQHQDAPGDLVGEQLDVYSSVLIALDYQDSGWNRVV